jgi:hypothetical protein
MKFKTTSLLGLSVLALGAVFAGQAQAAPAGCTISGIVTAGGMLTGTDVTSSTSSGSLNGNWDSLFGEGAGLITCDAWNFQSDFAYYDHRASASTGNKNSASKNFSVPEGHFGGDVFWRAPNSGAFGVQASYVTQTTIIPGFAADYLRLGAFGEYYLNDQATLGLGGHYFFSTHDQFGFSNQGKNHSGFELSADAKYYLSPDLKFSLTGELLNSQYTSTNFPGSLNLNGYAITAQADYQFNDSGLIGFIGGRYAHRTLGSDSSPDNLNINDKQVYVGMTFAFGGPKGASLVARDRNGPVNNTSTFLEKLPDPFSDLEISGLQSGGGGAP